MTEYHIVKVKLSDFQLDNCESAAKNATGLILRLSSDMIGTDETDFLHNLLLTKLPVFARFL